MDQFNTSQLNALQNVHAVLEPETSTISLFTTQGSRPVSIKNSIKLLGQDGSPLDVSQNASYILDTSPSTVRAQQQRTFSKPSQRSGDASASPSSQNQNNTFNGATPVQDNMAIGSGSNGGFDSRSNQSFHDNLNIPAAAEIPPTDTSLIGLDGNMMTGSSPRNFDNSFFGIGNNEMTAQNQEGNLNSSYIKMD